MVNSLLSNELVLSSQSYDGKKKEGIQEEPPAGQIIADVIGEQESKIQEHFLDQLDGCNVGKPSR